jgi:hypothetical protein
MDFGLPQCLDQQRAVERERERLQIIVLVVVGWMEERRSRIEAREL